MQEWKKQRPAVRARHLIQMHLLRSEARERQPHQVEAGVCLFAFTTLMLRRTKRQAMRTQWLPRQALAERYRIRGNVDIGSRRQVVSPSICGIPSRNGMDYASDPIEHVEDYRQGKGNAGQECWQAATARRLVSGNWGGKRFFFAVPTVRMAAACLPTYATTCSCGRVHPLACSAREPTCIPARCHLPDGQKITSACFLGRARFPRPCIKVLITLGR
ncbi:hypothetical protein MPH_02282 [Macrophomina phaseolina MS6]|uniref:Uncharacterized protein n=1 Tax=Macrophomina phaseolina (strain MS6) TaxID=1126212 RepID=K2S5Q9_MACPH|nr:hypothetical protein MPH_02282 [Macrophomina phaseolina MS6]